MKYFIEKLGKYYCSKCGTELWEKYALCEKCYPEGWRHGRD